MTTDSLKRYNEYLFEGKEEALAKLSKSEFERFERIRHVFTVWLDKPEMSDRKIRDYLETNFTIEKTQAYRDISLIKSLLGNVRNASKEWQRYTVIEMLKDAYTLAKKKKDPKAMAIAADKLGKYTNLDKEDPDLPDWNEFGIQDIDVVADVTILDLDPITTEEEQRLRQKYLGKQPIEDAVILEG